jgi:hypothetical protein
MVPAIITAEKYRRMKAVLVSAVGALAASQIMLVLSDRDVYVVRAGRENRRSTAFEPSR